MHGQPLLLLTNVGARTGQLRTSMVAHLPESDGSTLIVASFGAAAKHPAWYFNLAKHPENCAHCAGFRGVPARDRPRDTGRSAGVAYWITNSLEHRHRLHAAAPDGTGTKWHARVAIHSRCPGLEGFSEAWTERARRRGELQVLP
jgi:deazaflavin-dependent oxidoreductase (nitroreductase family)